VRFLLLIPGTGSFFCGSCLRDHALAEALERLGHEVTVAPLYLPLVLEQGESSSEVHMGGINVYLEERSALVRRIPRRLRAWLDAPRLLRWASRRGGMTDPRALGSLTHSMLLGEHGHQRQGVERLVAWAEGEPRPDVVVLSNILLGGVLRRLEARLRCPIVVTLQGEAPFLDALPPPHRERCWDALRDLVPDVAAFFPVSDTYGRLMTERLALPADRTHVVRNGIALDDFLLEAPQPSLRTPPTVGFLARLCADKGLPAVVDAFIELKSRGTVQGLRLRLAGAMLADDRPLVARLGKTLAAAGVAPAVDWLLNVDRPTKLEFLRSISMLSVPAAYGESFGLYLLEAMAAGVPVVQPDLGPFPEILGATGGGVLYEPSDPHALPDAWENLFLDPHRLDALSRKGRASVHAAFGSDRMAQEFVAACRLLPP
jgi:glycosyltransferase involved in cell wall biosynthesis